MRAGERGNDEDSKRIAHNLQNFRPDYTMFCSEKMHLRVIHIAINWRTF